MSEEKREYQAASMLTAQSAKPSLQAGRCQMIIAYRLKRAKKELYRADLRARREAPQRSRR